MIYTYVWSHTPHELPPTASSMFSSLLVTPNGQAVGKGLTEKAKNIAKTLENQQNRFKKTKRLYFETLWRGPQTENKKLEQKKGILRLLAGPSPSPRSLDFFDFLHEGLSHKVSE